MSDSIAVTAYTDDSPGPRVVVNVITVLTGTVTASLHRLWDDKDYIVPDADGIQATTGFVRTDYYPPLGVPVTYRVEMFNSNGASLGYGDAVTVTLDVPDSTAWITSPFNPALSVQVDMDDEAGSELVPDIVAAVHQIGGRKIVISEAVYGLTNIPMSFWVATTDDARLVDQIFRDGLGTAVFRVAPPMEVPRLLYGYGIPDRQEVNLPAGIEDTYFAVSVEETAAPATIVLVATLTYVRYTNNFATYGAFKQAYITYRDAQLNPPAEG